MSGRNAELHGTQEQLIQIEGLQGLYDLGHLLYLDDALPSMRCDCVRPRSAHLAALLERGFRTSLKALPAPRPQLCNVCTHVCRCAFDYQAARIAGLTDARETVSHREGDDVGALRGREQVMKPEDNDKNCMIFANGPFVCETIILMRVLAFSVVEVGLSEKRPDVAQDFVEDFVASI